MNTQRIHWARVVVAGILIEVVLIAMTIPLVAVFGEQFMAERAFLVGVPILVFVVGFLFGWWLGRKVPRPMLHGLLAGIVATVIYLGLILASSGSLEPAIAVYGLPLFVFANGMRIAGCIIGGAAGARGYR
jgi:hypothetical protein